MWKKILKKCNELKNNEIQISLSNEHNEDDIRTIYLPLHYMIIKMIHPNTIYKVTFIDKANKNSTLSGIILIKVLKYKTWNSIKHGSTTVTSSFNIFNTLMIENYVIKEFKPFKEEIINAPSCTINMIRVYGKPLDILLNNELGELLNGKTYFIKNGDIIMIKQKNFFNNVCKNREIFIKINSENKYSYLNNDTKVYQLSNINSLIPCNNSYKIYDREIIELLKDSVEKICELHEANKKLSNPIPLVLAFVGIENCDQIYAINRVSNLLSYQLIEMDIYDLWNNDKNCFDVKLFENFLMIHSFTPCIITIKNIGIIGDKDNENEYDLLIIEKIVNFINTLTSSVIVIFIVTFSEYTTFPLLLKNKLLYEIVLPTIKEEDRFKFFSHFYSKELSIYLASNTLGYSCNELKQVICDTNFFRKLEQSLENKKSFKNEKIYFDKAIEKRNKSLSVAFTVPSIPNVKWKDIGGLEETKLILQESLGINSKNYYNVKRSGIVLYGPPGCGKTLIAKAVANEFNTTFISVKGPELLNQYIGQSEENVRKLFEKARQASPCIIFFDEMDSLCPSQGRSSDSGGVMDRIVSQLLTELDTVNNNPDCQVFVIAATNRPDLLNQSLLSPGRFDKTVYIKAAEDVETKVKVLEAVSRKIKLSDDIELTKIASLCPNVMSGADLYSLMSNAVMESIRENIKLLERDNVDSRNLDNNEKFKIVVSIKHIIKSLEMFKNSITPSDLSHYNDLQQII